MFYATCSRGIRRKACLRKATFANCGPRWYPREYRPFRPVPARRFAKGSGRGSRVDWTKCQWTEPTGGGSKRTEASTLTLGAIRNVFEHAALRRKSWTAPLICETTDARGRTREMCWWVFAHRRKCRRARFMFHSLAFANFCRRSNVHREENAYFFYCSFFRADRPERSLWSTGDSILCVSRIVAHRHYKVQY